MDAQKLILSLPTSVQERFFAAALRTGRIWKIPQFAVLRRWYVQCGADERAMESVVKRARTWRAWTELWLAEAEDTHKRAKRELDAGHTVTARERFRAAAMAYAMALWQTNEFEARARVYPSLLNVFSAYGALTTPPIERLDIPFEPAPLPAHLRLPHQPGKRDRFASVVLVQGLDTIKESVGVVEQSFLDRGLAVLTIEQPGSGEARMRGDTLTGRDCLEAAAHAVVDAAAARPELDPKRIGVLGVSYGGFVAPFFAAVEPRFKALALLGAMWRFPEPEGMARNPFYGSVLRLMTGTDDEQRLLGILRQIELESVAHLITAPTAILQGSDDHLFVEGAHRLHDAVQGEKELHIIAGGDHGLTWHQEETTFLWDWLADRLGTRTDAHALARRSPARATTE